MQVERLQRDTDAYTCYAMAAFSAEIAAGVPVLLQKVGCGLHRLRSKLDVACCQVSISMFCSVHCLQPCHGRLLFFQDILASLDVVSLACLQQFVTSKCVMQADLFLVGTMRTCLKLPQEPVNQIFHVPWTHIQGVALHCCKHSTQTQGMEAHAAGVKGAGHRSQRLKQTPSDQALCNGSASLAAPAAHLPSLPFSSCIRCPHSRPVSLPCRFRHRFCLRPCWHC